VIKDRYYLLWGSFSRGRCRCWFSRGRYK